MTVKTLTLAALVTVLPTLSSAASLNTTDILSRTSEATLACLNWRVTGLCLWLDCDLLGCRLASSLKVAHYQPDLVVSNYNRLGENPWQEIRAALGIAQVTAASSILGLLTGVIIDSSGNRSEGTNQQDHKNLIFRETDAVGHPGLALLTLALPPSLICRSQALPFVPYYQSAIDALAWRGPLPESLYPASLIPGRREVGAWPAATWGSVYPRTGWTIQAEEPKAAALTAQRAADIVTRPGQPHLYRRLDGPAITGQRVWPPGPLIENDPDTGLWQMLAPATDPDCYVFGSGDSLTRSWANGRVDSEGDYVWNLWRPYQCCQRAGVLFLDDIDFAEITQ